MYFRQCSRSTSGQVTCVNGRVWAASSSDRATVRKDLAASLIFRAGRSSGFRTLREVRAGLARAGGELSADVALGNGIATGTHVPADLLDERRVVARLARLDRGQLERIVHRGLAQHSHALGRPQAEELVAVRDELALTLRFQVGLAAAKDRHGTPRNDRSVAASGARRHAGHASSGFDLDLLMEGPGRHRLRQHHGQNAVAELGSDLIARYAVWKVEASLERAVAALGEIAVLVLLLVLLTLLALQDQEVAGDGDVDVLLGHPGKLRGDLEGVLALGYVDRRHGHACHGVALPQRVEVEQLPHRRESEEAAGEPIEQPIHLAPECLPRIRANGPQRRGLFHRYRSGCHGRSPSCWRDGMTDHPIAKRIIHRCWRSTVDLTQSRARFREFDPGQSAAGTAALSKVLNLLETSARDGPFRASA